MASLQIASLQIASLPIASRPMASDVAPAHAASMQNPPIPPAPVFETRMVAHRSLSASGMRLVILLLTAASLLIGVLFAVLGAWPVPGFCGVEVLLACLLLRRNARDAQASETIVLNADALLLRRVDARGRVRETRLSPFWLRVEVQDHPASPLRVRLVDRHARETGGGEEVGRLLGEDARRELARRLRIALMSCR